MWTDEEWDCWVGGKEKRELKKKKNHWMVETAMQPQTVRCGAKYIGSII